MTQIGFFDPPPPPAVQLRPYQTEAVTKIREQLASDETRSTLIVMATGTGKTTVFADVIHKWPGKALVLVHRDELGQQAAKRIRSQTGRSVTIEKAEAYADRSADVVVASVQSLMREDRLQRFGVNEFGLVIADEAHHYVSPSFRKPIDWFTGAKVLGVTATPDRADEKALGQVFDDVAYVYDIEDAIRDGYLCQIRATQVFCEDLDLSDVKTVAGDLNQGQLDAVMQTEAVLHQVVKPTLELAGGRRTLVFTTSVENAHRMAEVFNRYKPDSAGAVDGSMDSRSRAQVLGDHQSGRIQFLVNVGVLTEGYDDPAIACVAMARPTKSRALYAQMAGRGTRLYPGKENLLILDFAGNAGRHALVTATDILGGNYDEETVERAKALAAKEQDADPRALLDEAAKQIAAEQERDRKRMEAASRARARVNRVGYERRDINPFAVLGIDSERPRWAGRFGDTPPSEKQLAALARMKIPVPENLSRSQASELLGAQIQRFKRGLCSFKQAQILQKQGFDTRSITFEQASRLIDALAKNNWQRLSAPERAALLERQPGQEG